MIYHVPSPETDRISLTLQSFKFDIIMRKNGVSERYNNYN